VVLGTAGAWQVPTGPEQGGQGGKPSLWSLPQKLQQPLGPPSSASRLGPEWLGRPPAPARRSPNSCIAPFRSLPAAAT
jgi:hypothetical protein